MTRTASEFIVDYCVRRGVPYVVGIPGHGNLTFVDALLDRPKDIRILMDLADLAAAFGASSARVDDPATIREVARAALSSGRPAVLDIRVTDSLPRSGNALGQSSEFPEPAERIHTR